MYTRILIPLNHYLRSERALELVSLLFPGEEPEIILLESTSNSISSYPVYTADSFRFDQFTSHGSHPALAINKMSNIAPKVRGFSVFGKPEDAVVKVAKSENVDLILIINEGNGELLQGEAFDRVVQAVSCPTLVIRGDQRPDSFLIILDGSEDSERILEPVFELATLFEAEVTLGQVRPSLADGASYSADRSELYLDDVVRRYRDVADRFELHVEQKVTHGQPLPVGRNSERKYSYDLIATAAKSWSHVLPFLKHDEAVDAIHQSNPALLITNLEEKV